MFSKLAVIFASFAVATAATSGTTTAEPVTTSGNVCNIGVLECCISRCYPLLCGRANTFSLSGDSIQPPQSAGVQNALNLLGLGPEYTGPGFVGLFCTPVRNPTGTGRFGWYDSLPLHTLGANCFVQQ